MTSTIYIDNTAYDSKYCAAWIKYNRIKQEISQEALAHKICSVSHLSYFENGKKNLREDLIRDLLKKLNFSAMTDKHKLGNIRQTFNTLAIQIETYAYDEAQKTFKLLSQHSDLLENTLYNIEFAVYKAAYCILVERKNHTEMKPQLILLDKVINALPDDLKYFYLLASGKLIYDFKNHKEGIQRLKDAYDLRASSWTNYRLGVAYYHDNQSYRAIKYLKQALHTYESAGRFYNALWCHSFLGMCMTALKDFEEAEKHFHAVLEGSEYFSMNKNIFSIYTNLAKLQYDQSNYAEAMDLCNKAIACSNQSFPDSGFTMAAWHLPDIPTKAACLYIESAIRAGHTDQTGPLFMRYLTKDNEGSRYYLYLRYLYLKLHQPIDENFITEVNTLILPYYTTIGFLDIHRSISLDFAHLLENKRQYKAANSIYKTFLEQ